MSLYSRVTYYTNIVLLELQFAQWKHNYHKSKLGAYLCMWIHLQWTQCCTRSHNSQQCWYRLHSCHIHPILWRAREHLKQVIQLNFYVVRTQSHDTTHSKVHVIMVKVLQNILYSCFTSTDRSIAFKPCPTHADEAPISVIAFSIRITWKLQFTLIDVCRFQE